MDEGTAPATQRAYARLAGYAYLANYVLAVTGTFIPPSLRGTGTFAARAARAVAARNEYGAAMASNVVAWLLILILAYALYVTLAPVNKRLAQIALLLQLGHAWMGCISIVLSFLVMRIYTLPQPALIADQPEYLIGIINSAGANTFNAAMLYVGAASLLFFYLFLKSRYIPVIIASFGIFASAILIGVSICQFIFPEYSGQWQYGWGPMGLAEVGTALWLVCAGIRTDPQMPAKGVPVPSAESACTAVTEPDVAPSQG